MNLYMLVQVRSMGFEAYVEKMEKDKRFGEVSREEGRQEGFSCWLLLAAGWIMLMLLLLCSN